MDEKCKSCKEREDCPEFGGMPSDDIINRVNEEYEYMSQAEDELIQWLIDKFADQSTAAQYHFIAIMRNKFVELTKSIEEDTNIPLLMRELLKKATTFKLSENEENNG